jgi:hypothetical protein
MRKDAAEDMKNILPKRRKILENRGVVIASKRIEEKVVDRESAPANLLLSQLRARDTRVVTYF